MGYGCSHHQAPAGQEDRNYFQKNIFEEEGLPKLPAKQVFHDFRSGGVMDILFIVESNQEARVQDQHGGAASPAIDDGVDLFAQALVPLRVPLRR